MHKGESLRNERPSRVDSPLVAEIAAATPWSQAAGRTDDRPETRGDERLLAAARQKLESDSVFGIWARQVDLTSQGGRVRAVGRVPSFYVKQRLQVLLRQLPDCQEIDNQVQVDHHPRGQVR